MSDPKLIAVYAGYGDTLLLQLATANVTDKPRFWLIDGGPVTYYVSTTSGKRPASDISDEAERKNQNNSYYQFLKQALLRFCCSETQDHKFGFRVIDLLDGIVVTHPHQDHMDGIIQLLSDWLPKASDDPSKDKPLLFKGPIILNDLFLNDESRPEGYLRNMLEEDKEFERLVWDNVPSVPGLVHGTPPGHQLYKMVAKSSTRSAFSVNVDTSAANISSIITSYRPPSDMDWPIVTTGDTTGEHVLAQLGYISADPLRPQKPVTTLSIFKVPHHGSQRNSHAVDKISITDRGTEKPEFFFLALSAWYLGSEDFARRMNIPVDPVLAQFRSRIYLSRVWDWSAVSHVDTPAFGPAMDSAFEIFQSYLEVYNFRYSPLNLALNGANWSDWITFTKLLLDRFHTIEQSIRDGNPTFPPGYVSRLTSPSGRKFLVNQVKQTAGAHAPYVYGVPWYLVDNSMNSLNYDPFTLLQLVSKIVEFYQRFDARNYVISANRLRHNHPNPTVIAAIMAAAFSRNDNSIRRVFVTDPWALNIEEIIYYLGFLEPTVTRDRWRDRVRLFYLEEDYVAAVPIDTTTDVPGCTEFRIDAATDLTEVRFELHNQFSRVNAYNTPFSTWLTHSSFAVSILDPTSPATPFGWLTIVNNPLRFDLFTQSQNIPLVELGRTGPSPAQRGSTLNMSLYSMTLVGSPLLTIADIVFLQRGEWYQLVIGQEILCYTKDDTTNRIELNFQPLTPTPTGIARLQFETQFQPPNASLARQHTFDSSSASLSPLALYLQAVGFNDDPDQISIAGVAGSIAGFELVLGFFSLIPSSILSVIEFPTWLVNSDGTTITFEPTPIGTDVQEAKLIAVVPAALKSVSIGGLNFGMKSVFLHLVETDSWTGEPYVIKLCMDLFLGVGQSGLSISLEVTKDTTGQVFLNFTGAPSSLSLEAVFGKLGFTAPTTLLLPFNGPDAMYGMPDLVGFTFVVPCAGASVVSLQNIFAQVTSSDWHPWEDILPENFWPKDSTVTVAGIITQPQSTATLAVGLQIGFSIPLVESTANVLLDVSYWPIKSNNRDPTQRSKLQMRIDPKSTLPAPTIDDILRALGGFSWSTVTTAIPLLQQLTAAVSITNVVVELERAPTGGPVIALFSISALISNLKLIPKLTVEKAVLDLTYTGSSWRAQIETTILFADQYRCRTLLILPTKEVAGKFEFVNLDDAFTFGAFVKAIDPTIDITAIPVVGSETLASISLGSFSLTATFVGNSLSVTSFAVEIAWDTSSIKQLNVSNNRLTINWSRRPFPNIPAIVGQVDPSSGGTENSWRLNWEGLLSDNWILSAGFQFSRLKLDSQPSKSELVLAGSILNLSDTDVSAADLTNSLTGDGTGPSSLWQGSMPSDSYFSMRELAVNCMLGEDQVYGIGAKAIWGQGGSGSAVLVVRGIQPVNPNDSHWAFMLAVAVDNFRFKDLTSDVDLGQAVDNNLTIINASVLAFYEPVAKTLVEIKAALDNVKATHLLPSTSSVIPLEGFSADSSLKTTAGLAVFASLSFHPPQADSAMGSLNVVANSTLPSTNVDVFGYFSKDDQSNRTIAFGASIESLQIFPSVMFDKIAVLYTAHISNEKSSDFSLSGSCQIGFLSHDTWTLNGELRVHSGQSTTASFSFGSPNAFTLSELIKLQVSNIKFVGDYDFGAREDTDINSGTVSSGGRSAVYHISLSADVSLGNHGPVTVALIFVSGAPGVLTVVAGSVNLASLVKSIFDENFAQDLLDISLERLFMYYAWSSEYTTKPVSDGTGTRDGKYVLGYHAECDSQIYGIQFVLSLDILGGNNNDSGIKATATKAAPVEVICVTLHGVKGAKTTGPSFGFSTITNDGKGFFIQAGVALFETTIGDIVLSYDFNPPSPEVQGFHGKLRTSDVDIKFLPNVEVEFELVKIGGEYRLRFVKLPTVFQAFLDAAKLASTIYDLTEKDKCGAVELLFDKIVTSSIDADVSLADSQQGEDPAKGSGGITSIVFNVTGKYTLSIGGIDVPVVFKPLTFTVNSIPTSLKSFGESLLDFITDNIPALIQGLLDNTDNFGKVLGLITLKKLTLETIKALICRGEYTPEPAEGDGPGPNQKPDQGKTTDKGGMDGDGYFDDTTGAPSGSGSVGGGSSVAKDLEDQGVVEDIPEYVFDVFGVTPSSAITPTPQTVYPLDSPGTPPHAPDSDPYGQIIEDTTSKDFERWASSADYATAVSDALACALEYRAAIMLLRQVLQSSSVAPKLGKSFFDDYTARRTVLVYNFSTLSTRFAQKWLDMSGISVYTNVTGINSDGTRELEVSWSRLRSHETMVTAVTLYINGITHLVKAAFGSDSTTITIPGPLCLDLNVQVRVTAFAALYGGTPQYKTDYAFFAQGRSGVGSFIESAAVGFRSTSDQPPSPPSQEGYQWVPLPYSSNYPVLTIGNYTYWGVSKLEYGQGDGSLGLIVYDEKNRKSIRHWYDFRLENTQYLDSITYTPGDTNVVFHGQSGRSTSIAANRLLAVPFIISGDATQQPAPPSGMMYANETQNGGTGDLTQYPVLLLGPWSIWSVTDRNGGDLPKGALLFFDADNKLVKTTNSSIFPPMYKIDNDSFDWVGWTAGNRMSWGFTFNGFEEY